MKYRLIVFSLIVWGTFTACDGDFRQKAQGLPSEVVVLMDSTRIDGAVGQALQDVYGEFIRTMPRPEPRYDLRFRDIRTQAELQQVQKARNLIIAATLDEQSNVGLYVRSLLSEQVKDQVRAGAITEIPLKDRWYRDQWILIYVGTDEEQLAQRIRNNSRPHLNSLHEIELDRWELEVYRRGEQPLLADSLWSRHGFRIRVQHDYHIGVDTTNFVSMRRYLEDNDRWMWVYYMDGVDDPDFITERWIHQKRDSLLYQYIRGSRDSTFVRSDFRRPYETRFSKLNGRDTWVSRGTWIMNDYSMGGPYLSYVMYDEGQQRIYFMEFAQFSPRYRQRRFLYQFEAIARTFETNPNFEISIHDDGFDQTITSKLY